MLPEDRLKKLDSYLTVIDERVRTSRRASEIFFDMPKIPDAVEGERLIREDLQETYKDFSQQENQTDAIDRIDIAAIKDEYWDGARRVGEISGALPNATIDDYFKVDVERSEKAIREQIVRDYDPISPPRQLLGAIERYMDGLGIDAMTASRVATKHLRLQLPFMKLKAKELIDTGLDELEATNEVFEEFAAVSVEAHVLRLQQSGETNPLHGFVSSVVPKDKSLVDTAGPLRLRASDATGLTKVYKLERRPYTDDELELANELTSQSTIQACLLTFQMALVEYSTSYLKQNPERMKHSLLPFSEFFVQVDGVFVPNPKLIKVLCNNYLPAVAGIMLSEGITTQQLRGEHFARAAVDAKERRVFFAQIATYNNFRESDQTVELDSFINRVCPGMTVLTDSLESWMPRIYERL